MPCRPLVEKENYRVAAAGLVVVDVAGHALDHFHVTGIATMYRTDSCSRLVHRGRRVHSSSLLCGLEETCDRTGRGALLRRRVLRLHMLVAVE